MKITRIIGEYFMSTGLFHPSKLLELLSKLGNKDYRRTFHEFGVMFNPAEPLEQPSNSEKKDHRTAFHEFGV